MGTFKKGATFGALLGAGLMWLTTTKKGKEVRTSMLDKVEELYPEIRDQIMSSSAYKTMTKNKYKGIVENTVNKYAKDNKAVHDIKDLLTKMLVSQWSKIKKEINKKTK